MIAFRISLHLRLCLQCSNRAVLFMFALLFLSIYFSNPVLSHTLTQEHKNFKRNKINNHSPSRNRSITKKKERKTNTSKRLNAEFSGGGFIEPGLVFVVLLFSFLFVDRPRRRQGKSMPWTAWRRCSTRPPPSRGTTLPSKPCVTSSELKWPCGPLTGGRRNACLLAPDHIPFLTHSQHTQHRPATHYSNLTPTRWTKASPWVALRRYVHSGNKSATPSFSSLPPSFLFHRSAPRINAFAHKCHDHKHYEIYPQPGLMCLVCSYSSLGFPLVPPSLLLF